MTATHIVPSAVFDDLANGNGDVMGPLRDGQRSKRLLLLHELMSTTRDKAAAVFAAVDADRSFAVLADAQRTRRGAVEDLLLHPHVGAWATGCLRELLKEGSSAPDLALGHLGAVAATAALRAGLAFDVATVARDGEVTFPTLGTARLPFEGSCRIRSRPGAGGVEVVHPLATVTIDFRSPSRGRAAWLPVRRLRSTAGGLDADIELNDVDPFRGCGHLPVADRLGDAAFDRWQAVFDEAWSLLVDDHRPVAEAIATGVRAIVPLVAPAGGAERSASCHEAIGAVAMTAPSSALVLAEGLVHEFQHNKLSALLDLVPLVERSSASFYAPWRPDPRPLRGLLHGTYAYLGIATFWEAHRRGRGRDDEWADFEFALAREQVSWALGRLISSQRLKLPGARFVDGMYRRLRDLHRLPVATGPRLLARLAGHDHATSWRLRNLQPQPGLLEEWAAAWLAHRPCPWAGPLRAEAVDGGGPMPSATRLAMLRQRLASPKAGRVDHATTGDTLLTGGEVGKAGPAYLQHLSEQPDDLAAWAGLTLAHRELQTGAAWALTNMPETVRGLCKTIEDRSGDVPSRDKLAEWIAAGARENLRARARGSALVRH